MGVSNRRHWLRGLHGPSPVSRCPTRGCQRCLSITLPPSLPPLFTQARRRRCSRCSGTLPGSLGSFGSTFFSSVKPMSLFTLQCCFVSLLRLCVVTKAPLVDSFEDIFHSSAHVVPSPKPHTQCPVASAGPLKSHRAPSHVEFITPHPHICFHS